MASVALSVERASAATLPTGLPIWWRQPHTYALATMTVLHVAGFRGAMHLLDDGYYSAWLGESVIGGLLAQCFLLGLWGALGGLATLPRWGIVGLALATGAATISLGSPGRVEGSGAESLEMGLIGAMLVLVFAAAILPLRRLAGWRIDFDARYHPPIRGRRGQVSFMDFAAYSLGVAAALAATRLAVQADVLDAESLLEVAVVMVAVTLSAAPVVYALAAWRNVWLTLLAAGLWTMAVAAANSWLAHFVPVLDVFGETATSFAAVRLHLVTFYAGIALLVATTLITLRCFGLKLIVVQERGAV